LIGMEKWVQVGAVTPEKTHRIVSEMLQSAQRPTAIIASDSIIALEVSRLTVNWGLASQTMYRWFRSTMRTGHP